MSVTLCEAEILTSVDIGCWRQLSILKLDGKLQNKTDALREAKLENLYEQENSHLCGRHKKLSQNLVALLSGWFTWKCTVIEKLTRSCVKTGNKYTCYALYSLKLKWLLLSTTTPSVARRDRLVVRTSRCGPSNPSSNSGPDIAVLFPLSVCRVFFYYFVFLLV